MELKTQNIYLKWLKQKKERTDWLNRRILQMKICWGYRN